MTVDLEPDEEGTLLGLRWDEDRSRLIVFTAAGRISVPARSLDVELEVTDEVVSLWRRRVGRIVPFDSTVGPL